MTLRFYQNRGGRFALEEPDQVIKLSGRAIRPTFVDIDGDGHVELAVLSNRISKLDALTGGSVVRTTLIYRGDPKGVFGSRPSFKSEEKFSAREVKALSTRVFFEADLTGDGHTCALGLDRDGAVVARAIDDDLEVDDESFWRFVPRRTVIDIDLTSLNDDRRTDLLVRHMKSLTILVSKP